GLHVTGVQTWLFRSDGVLRVATHARTRGTGDERDRIRRARILRVRVVVEGGHARMRVDDGVLEDRAEAAARRVDERLALGREADHLRVVAALEVEDAVLGPAVLVVADE